MTNSTLDDLRTTLASALSIDISEELQDKKRVALIHNSIFEALDYVKNSQDDILESIKQADESLIAHVNRRL